MTALAEKMKEAGVDTIGAKFTAMCLEALRRNPGDVLSAWRWVGAHFGLHFLEELKGDMDARPMTVSEKESMERLTADVDRQTASLLSKPTVGNGQKILDGLTQAIEFTRAKPYQPRVISPERLERRRELKKVVEKYFTSSGVAWLKVGWHELRAMVRDGDEAQALLNAGPASVPNDGRDVEAVLGRKEAERILENVRNASARS